jgi:hypothetical protein
LIIGDFGAFDGHCHLAVVIGTAETALRIMPAPRSLQGGPPGEYQRSSEWQIHCTRLVNLRELIARHFRNFATASSSTTPFMNHSIQSHRCGVGHDWLAAIELSGLILG